MQLLIVTATYHHECISAHSCKWLSKEDTTPNYAHLKCSFCLWISSKQDWTLKCNTNKCWCGSLVKPLHLPHTTRHMESSTPQMCELSYEAYNATLWIGRQDNNHLATHRGTSPSSQHHAMINPRSSEIQMHAHFWNVMPRHFLNAMAKAWQLVGLGSYSPEHKEIQKPGIICVHTPSPLRIRAVHSRALICLYAWACVLSTCSLTCNSAKLKSRKKKKRKRRGDWRGWGWGRTGLYRITK